MIPNSNLEKWQKAIQGIEAGQKDLSSEELSAFQALKGLFNDGNFESSESKSYINAIKDNLKQHDKHRLLKAHLTNFTALCEQHFTNKSVPVIQPQAPVPLPAPASASSNVSEQNVFPTFQPPTFKPTVNPEIISSEPIVETPVINIPPPSNIPPVPPESKDNKEGVKSNKQLILIIVAIAVLIGGWLVYKNWESIIKFFEKNKTVLADESIANNPLVGAWKGILNNEPATLEFLSIDTIGNIKAQIYFSENRPDTLKLIGSIDGHLIELKDNIGKYSGVLQQDSSFYYGTFYNKNTGTSSNFSFRNPKITIDSLSEQIEQPDIADLSEQVKDSAVIASTAQENEKPVSNNSLKTYTQPSNQSQRVIEKPYPFGIYKGSTINGFPEGNGKMIYNRQVQIAKQDTKSPPHFASSGDYFVGSWGNGDIISGTLYDKNGNEKERILAPKRINLHDISND